jgi:SAM-dependent methyltransferase
VREDGDGATTSVPPVLVRGVGEKLPFADRSFDGVFLCETLDHALDPARVLREARRVLVPGGVLAVLQSVRGPAPEPPLSVRLRVAAGRARARLLGRRQPLPDRDTKMHVLEGDGVAALVSAEMDLDRVESHAGSVLVRAIRRTP